MDRFTNANIICAILQQEVFECLLPGKDNSLYDG